MSTTNSKYTDNLGEFSLSPEKKFYTVWSFDFQGNKQELIDVFKKYSIPYSFSDCTLIQPHQFVVQETAGDRSPVHQELKECGVDVEVLGYEPTHRIVYEHAYKECYGAPADV